MIMGMTAAMGQLCARAEEHGARRHGSGGTPSAGSDIARTPPGAPPRAARTAPARLPAWRASRSGHVSRRGAAALAAA